MNTLTFLSLAAACAIQAVRLGGWGWLLVWPAVAFAVIALAYAGVGVAIYGKRADGTFGSAWRIANWPARSVMETIWWISNVIRREEAFHEIIPGLYLGRRPGRALPDGVQCVVDLAGELSGAPCAKKVRLYWSVPMLDRWVLADEVLIGLVERIARQAEPTLVHCAQGHGRSAQIVAAVLIARGQASSPGEAIEYVRSRRPAVRLARVQRAQLERCFPRLLALSGKSLTSKGEPVYETPNNTSG